jgi:hypothetical protein
MNDIREWLGRWPDLWSVPELWAWVHSPDRLPGARSLVSALLRTYVTPVTPEQAFQQHVGSGRFRAANTLLAEGTVLTAGLSDAQVRGLRRRLDTARAERSEQVAMRVFMLQKRLERLARDRAPQIDEYLADALRVVSDRADEADALLDLADEETTAAEGLLRDELLTRVDAAAAAAPDRSDVARWRGAIDAALQSGDWMTAEQWIYAGVTASVLEQRQSRRPAWNFSLDTRDALDWFCRRDAGHPRPPTFDREWAPTDEVGNALLDCLDEIETTKPAIHDRSVQRLLRILDTIMEGGSRVTVQAMPTTRTLVELATGSGIAIYGRLRQIIAPGLYAFDDVVYEDGIPFVVTAQREGAAELERAISDLDEPNDGAALPFFSGVSIVYGPVPSDRPAETALALDARDFFPLLGASKDRDRQLVYTLAGRLPLASAFPRPVPTPRGDFVVGRESLMGRCIAGGGHILVVGPSGIGRTALLRAIEREIGTTRVRVITGKSESVERGVSEAISHPGTVVLVDDIDDASQDTARWLLEKADGDVRVIATSSSESLWGKELSPRWQVEPLVRLDWSHAYAMTSSLLEPLDVEFAESSALDRFVYYTGGHPTLIHSLLWELCQQLDAGVRTGLVRIRTSDLQLALDAPAFRAEAKSRLLGVLERHPALQVCLGALVVPQSRGLANRDVATNELVQYPEMLGVRVSEAQAATGMARLSVLGLCEEGVNGRWCLPKSGLARLVLDGIGDTDSYLETAVARCVKSADGALVGL